MIINAKPANRLHRFYLTLLLTLFTAAGCANDGVEPTSTTPAQRSVEYSWMSIAEWNRMFAEDLAVARAGNVDLLFVGDSITAGWPHSLWMQYFAAYRPANFGIGGDQTGNLLWRLEHGEIDKLKPKVVVLMIGVNNLGLSNETPKEVFQGVEANVKRLRRAFPKAKILVNGIFPSQQSPQHPMRARTIEANKMIASLGDNKQVFYRDYGHLLLQADGSISPEIMADFLHPTETGYRVWAEAMMPGLRKWLD